MLLAGLRQQLPQLVRRVFITIPPLLRSRDFLLMISHAISLRVHCLVLILKLVIMVEMTPGLDTS
jgi:hypothetical protein